MVKIAFTPALKRFFPQLAPVVVKAHNVAEAIDQLEEHYPGLKDYIIDDRGHLRKHVNIFIGNTLIQDKTTLQDSLQAEDELFIMQALSGG